MNTSMMFASTTSSLPATLAKKATQSYPSHVWENEKNYGKKRFRSTVAALGFVIAPAIAMADIPTNPPSAVDVAQGKYELAKAIYSFETFTEEKEIFSFLDAHVDASRLLSKLPFFSEAAFGRGAKTKVEMVLDRETNEYILRVEIKSKITNEENFFIAEEKLFDLIVQAKLDNGLQHVVLSLY